jgi:hypothetical protein
MVLFALSLSLSLSVGLGFELSCKAQSRHSQSRLSTAGTLPPVHFGLFILEMEFQELGAPTGLKP